MMASGLARTCYLVPAGSLALGRQDRVRGGGSRVRDSKGWRRAGSGVKKVLIAASRWFGNEPQYEKWHNETRYGSSISLNHMTPSTRTAAAVFTLAHDETVETPAWGRLIFALVILADELLSNSDLSRERTTGTASSAGSSAPERTLIM